MAHADSPSTQPGDQRSICRQASRCSRTADPAHTRAARSSSAAWQAWGASQSGRHATEPREHGIQGRPHASQHCAAVRARSSMAIDRVAWQSLERLRHGHVPARSVHARRRQVNARWALGRLVQDWIEAYRRIVGTIEFRQLVPRRRLRLRPRWCVLARSAFRTTIALRDAVPAACLVIAAWPVVIDPVSTSSASSTPAVRTCCNDWLNLPSTPARTSGTC